MKRILLLAVTIMMLANVAMADHIGIYPDETGSSCNIAPGFSAAAAVIHKFTLGATGSRFKLDLGSAPGTSFFGFNTPYVPVGALTSDLSLGYGQCIAGSIVLGTVLAIWAPGAVSIVAADLQLGILYTDCSFGEYFATGGHMSINGDGHGCDGDPVQPSSWGKVKALYR